MKISTKYDDIESQNIQILKKKEALIKEKNSLEEEFSNLGVYSEKALTNFDSSRDPRIIENELLKNEIKRDKSVQDAKILYSDLNTIKTEYEEISMICELQSGNMQTKMSSETLNQKKEAIREQITDIESQIG